MFSIPTVKLTQLFVFQGLNNYIRFAKRLKYLQIIKFKRMIYNYHVRYGYSRS